MEVRHAGRKRDREGKAVARTIEEDAEDAFWADFIAEVEAAAEVGAEEKADAMGEEETNHAAACEGNMPEETDDQEPPDFYELQARATPLSGTICGPATSAASKTPALIDPMRFTDKAPSYACTVDTLQMFSVRVAEIRGDLRWPLHVYGVIAARDHVDHNRNIMFSRTRDNCQILTEKDSSLVLTGPSRAVVVLGPVMWEAELKVKGSTESEDKVLSFIAVGYDYQEYSKSRVMNRGYTSKLSTLNFTFAQVVWSVEATIKVQVTEGSWPDDFRGQVAVCTASMGDKKFVLLDSGHDKMPVAFDGTVELSRRVACVELAGELIVSVKAWQGEGDNWSKIAEDKVAFKPKKGSRSYGKCDVDFCKVKVTVAWSLLSYNPEPRRSSEEKLDAHLSSELPVLVGY
ncbi:hypothetical protein ACP70R_025771 [Stipagrostis hirtigluma subsp. patula]